MSDLPTNNVKDYSFQGFVGSGNFSACYKVTHKSYGSVSVWKAIDYDWMPRKDREFLLCELQTLSGIRHPNIVQFYSVMNNPGSSNAYLRMEFCKGGTVMDLLRKRIKQNKPLEESFIWDVLCKLLKALKFLFTEMPNMKMIDCSITPSDILIDECFNIKLGGFRLSDENLRKYSKHITIPSASRIPYTSPEVLMSDNHTEKSHVWSLGCVIHELASFTTPYSSSVRTVLLNAINTRARNQIPSSYSHNLQRIIDTMLEPKPTMRLSFDDMLRHPVVKAHIQKNTRKMPAFDHDKENVRPKHEDENECLSCMDLEQKLEFIKKKEAAIELREFRLKTREISLTKREKQMAYLQHIYPNGQLGTRSLSFHDTVNDTSMSGDENDSGILPVTAARLDPREIEKPKFAENRTSRKIVRFDNEFGRNASRERPNNLEFKRKSCLKVTVV